MPRPRPAQHPIVGWRHDLAIDPGHRKYAEKVARYYFGRYGGRVPLDEFLGECNLVLTLAAARFDPEKSVPFVAYLGLVARGAMINVADQWLPYSRSHRGKPQPVIGTILDVAHPPDPDTDWQEWSDYQDLAERFASKAGPPHYRQILRAYLTRADCRTTTELGHHLGIAQSTACHRLNAAIEAVGGLES